MKGLHDDCEATPAGAKLMKKSIPAMVRIRLLQLVGPVRHRIAVDQHRADHLRGRGCGVPAPECLGGSAADTVSGCAHRPPISWFFAVWRVFGNEPGHPQEPAWCYCLVLVASIPWRPARTRWAAMAAAGTRPPASHCKGQHRHLRDLAVAALLFNHQTRLSTLPDSAPGQFPAAAGRVDAGSP